MHTTPTPTPTTIPQPQPTTSTSTTCQRGRHDRRRGFGGRVTLWSRLMYLPPRYGAPPDEAPRNQRPPCRRHGPPTSALKAATTFRTDINTRVRADVVNCFVRGIPPHLSHGVGREQTISSKHEPPQANNTKSHRGVYDFKHVCVLHHEAGVNTKLIFV